VEEQNQKERKKQYLSLTDLQKQKSINMNSDTEKTLVFTLKTQQLFIPYFEKRKLNLESWSYP